MKNFVLLSSGGSMPEEAEMAQVMKDWEAWYGQLGSAVVDPGNPMSAAKSIDPDGSVKDGPTGTMPNGYIILQADSLDAATKWPSPARYCKVVQISRFLRLSQECKCLMPITKQPQLIRAGVFSL